MMNKMLKLGFDVKGGSSEVVLRCHTLKTSTSVTSNLLSQSYHSLFVMTMKAAAGCLSFLPSLGRLLVVVVLCVS